MLFVAILFIHSLIRGALARFPSGEKLAAKCLKVSYTVVLEAQSSKNPQKRISRPCSAMNRLAPLSRCSCEGKLIRRLAHCLKSPKRAKYLGGGRSPAATSSCPLYRFRHFTAQRTIAPGRYQTNESKWMRSGQNGRFLRIFNKIFQKLFSRY